MRTPKKLEVEMNPEVLAGQMILAGFEGKTAGKELKEALSRGWITGVILFDRNIESPRQVRDLTDAVRDAAPYPPIIAVDHEGGRVQRLKGPFTRWPAARGLGRKADPRLARDVAMAMAAELLAVGVNLNLAPVLDLDLGRDNAAIGDRALATDPALAGSLGAAMIEGFNEAGIISCPKHFPGHGDAAEDSHQELAVIAADRATLDHRELVPFREAIKARAPMIMAGHLKVPALDKYYPASISRTILHELLREQLGFDGVIVTDDLEMGALAKYMPLADAAFSAVRAGADLLLVCSGLKPALAVRETLLEAVKQRALAAGELARAALGVLALKEERLMAGPPPRTAIAYSIGNDDHQELAKAYSA
jgi:beta-N-acetylhexosaminidase